MLFDKKPAPKLISFRYSSRGGMRGCHYEYCACLTDDGSKIEIAESDCFNMPIRRQKYNVSSELMDALTEITSKYNLHKWHAFKLFAGRLLDAPDLSVSYEFENGASVHYGHGEILPEYGVHSEIIDRIKEYCRSENSDLMLSEKAETEYDDKLYICITNVKHGYASVDITYRTDKHIETDVSYKVYSEDTLLCENSIEHDEYRPLEFYPDHATSLLIDLNQCGKLHAGRYAIELLGARCEFNLVNTEAK